MTSNDDVYYKTMYHTMLIAADKAVDTLVSGKDTQCAVDILIQAMEESEEIFISETLPARPTMVLTHKDNGDS